MNDPINKLQQLFFEQKFPHAVMLTGKHVDLVQAGLTFINWLFCINKKDSIACGICNNCKLLHANTFPDFMQVIPTIAGNNKSIKIAAVREIIQFVQISPQFSKMKIVMLCEAEYLNMQAANALLKTLEEPPAAVFMILTVTEPELLLDTILSRCFIINLATNINEVLPNKLLFENLVLDLYNVLINKNIDVVSTIDKWIRIEAIELLTCLWCILTELIYYNYKLPGHYFELGINGAKLSKISMYQSLRQLWSILDKVVEIRKDVFLGKQVNVQLFLEKLIISWNRGIA